GIAITGSLFAPGEYVGLWMTLPNNAVRSLPTQVADGNGDFFVVIDLDERLPTGRYSITAKGVASGRLQIAGFDVTPGSFQPVSANNPAEPVPAVVESNVGDRTEVGALTTTSAARASVTFLDRTGAADIVRVEGSGYAPNEPVGIWMTFPDGAVLGMASLNVDSNGAFSVDVDLGVVLTAGRYRVSVQGVDSNRLVIVTFDAADRDAPGGVAPSTAPIQTLGGPTNLGGAAGNPGPEQTPRDQQRCAEPEAFWTPDC
ncbi:MAG: hypothetical protein ACP5MJ_14880, partial [Roseiflexus sp.]